MDLLNPWIRMLDAEYVATRSRSFDRWKLAISCRLGLHRSVSHELNQRVNHFCSREQSDFSGVVVDWSHFHYIENVSKRVID
jgi:hypothetical protein